MRLRLLACVLAASFASACATSTPVCRAPLPEEMSAFRAIISHNPNALAQSMAPGTTRSALEAGDHELNAYIWGSGGETRGSVISMLNRPPLCILPNPAAISDETSREILVYPQQRYDRVTPLDPAAVTLPYGTHMRDYLTCRFELTDSGWQLADACGYRPRYRSVAG